MVRGRPRCLLSTRLVLPPQPPLSTRRFSALGFLPAFEPFERIWAFFLGSLSPQETVCRVYPLLETNFFVKGCRAAIAQRGPSHSLLPDNKFFPGYPGRTATLDPFFPALLVSGQSPAPALFPFGIPSLTTPALVASTPFSSQGRSVSRAIRGLYSFSLSVPISF